MVTGMILRDGLLLTGTGVACGLAAAAFLTRLMAGLLYGVSTAGPLTYAAVAAVLLAAALPTTDIPPRRASTLDPALALRAE